MYLQSTHRKVHPCKNLEVKVKYAALVAVLALIASAAYATDVSTTNSTVKDDSHVSGVIIEGGMSGGETIETAVVIGSLPFTDSGDLCAYMNDYDEICPFSGSTSPDAVYSYTPGAPYACNDDYCSGPNYPYSYDSFLGSMAVTAGHTYYIVVDGYGGDCGTYVIDIIEHEIPVLECPTGALLEGEPDCYDNYEDQTNGGCNSVPEVFGYICPAGGDLITLCGTSGTYSYFGSSYRDTDWFEIEVTEQNSLTFCAIAEFPLLIFFIDGNYGCAGLQIISYTTADPMVEACLSGTFYPGIYWLWVGPSIFTGVPCGSDYIMTLEGFTGMPSPVESSTWGSIKGLFK
jgi:hypothetical protein